MGRSEATISDDGTAVVERQRWREDGDEKPRGNARVEQYASALIAAEGNAAFESQECAQPLASEVEDAVDKGFWGQALLRVEAVGAGVLFHQGSEGFEKATDFLLEDDDGRKGEVEEKSTEDLLKDVEVE